MADTDNISSAAVTPAPPSAADLFYTDSSTPRWIKDIFRFLSVKSQFIVSGNIRDRYPFPVGTAKYVPLALLEYLAEALKLRGYKFFLTFNTVDGFAVVTPRGENDHIKEIQAFFADKFKVAFNERGRFKCSLEKSLEIIEQIVELKDSFVAVFADLASHYAVRIDSLTEPEHEYFTKVLRLSHSAQPHTTPEVTQSQFNPIFWLCDRENDLPSWLSLGNPRIRSVIVPQPDHIIRRTLIREITPSLPGQLQAPPEIQARANDAFVDQTEGMTLTDVIAITQLCRREGLNFADIGEAVRRYKLGVTEDPWSRIDRAKIVNGDEIIRKRVKGQQQAVTKTLDIIKRAMTGLSGAQGTKVGGKPRGVMFLAGPTGTGKTELAKTLTELLFGDERAYIRFDMSEFSAEHADQRLLGAPPGYVGYDAGGELTNAIREKPFAVVLFDEIEKANPRILDKFLQLLDDGVLTSGRGERVYFSEAVIIFTSNLGISRIDSEGNRVPNVLPEEPYADVERKVRTEIEKYFKNFLGRPEILNRIGENIVVFDFIRPDTATQIYEKMKENILARLQERQQIRITLPAEVDAQLRARCIRDLSNGGRGVGNQLEALFINPLARALFDMNITSGAAATVAAINEDAAGVPVVELSQ